MPERASTSVSHGKIQHVIIMIQENRSFDNFFATFPGADGATSGLESNGNRLQLQKADLVQLHDLCHSHWCYLQAYDGGKMDGFNLGADYVGLPAFAPYQYVDPKQIAPYWTLAKQYVLADHMFQTQGSASFTAHQDLIAGDTAVSKQYHVIDVPYGGAPWGCDAPAGSVTPLIDRHGWYLGLTHSGPFPCFTYRTLRDLLDRAGLSWRFYTEKLSDPDGAGALWNAFDAIKAVRYGPEWKTNISSPNTNIFADIRAGNLAAVSWVIPDGSDSDHPGHATDTGPSWIAQTVNAVGNSEYWKSTVIIVVWDDWGGLYDHVPPQQLGYGGLGFRVPCLIISSYAKKGYVSHSQYEFGSILRFIEDNWDLGRIGTTDVRANGLSDAFEFGQPSRKFRTIRAKYSRDYFVRRGPTIVPPDND